MDDRAAIDAVRRGDHSGFSVLVTRYQDQLYTLAFRLTGSAPDAADAVQETFTRAFTHVRDLRADTLRAWLFRVATNCVRDQQRKRSRHPEISTETDHGKIIEMPDPSIGPEQTTISHESARMIRAALLRLPSDSREVIVLRDVNDLSYPEIAEVLGCPLGTVKSRISRARSQLLEQLKNSPGFADQFAGGHQ